MCGVRSECRAHYHAATLLFQDVPEPCAVPATAGSHHDQEDTIRLQSHIEGREEEHGEVQNEDRSREASSTGSCFSEKV